MAPSKKKNSERNALNTAICSLCGEPNQCAVAADPNATECWCEFVEFPHELLARIPEEAVRKTCVCKNCLANYLESKNPADSSNLI